MVGSPSVVTKPGLYLDGAKFLFARLSLLGLGHDVGPLLRSRLALSKMLQMVYLGVTPVPLPRQNLVYDLRKLTELNAVDMMSAMVCFRCIIAASIIADPELHENDLAQLSHRMTFQIFAVHQAVDVAKLVSALYLWSRKLRECTYHSPIRRK
jgi:hypothetical protein